MIKNNKFQKLLFILSISIMPLIGTSPAFAANVKITGGSNGAACNSGGYFTPGSVTINGGDTVTISVPANDPYAYGEDVHGFPEGTFTIARGGSHTTQPITKSVSYYGTWPSSGCKKGSGTITVKAAATSPAASTATPPKATGTTGTTTTTSPAPTKSASPATNSPSPSPATATNNSNYASPTGQYPATNGYKSFKSVAYAGGGLVAAFVLIALAVWYFVFRPRKKVVPPAAAATAQNNPNVTPSESVAPQNPPENPQAPTEDANHKDQQ
jgi:hypothetical protein